MDPVIPVSITYVGGMIAAEILNNEDAVDFIKNKLRSYRKDKLLREPLQNELVLGYDPFSYDRTPIIADMYKNPHMLVSGLSQQGKSSMVEYALRGRQSIILNAIPDNFSSLDPIERITDYEEMIYILGELINAGRSKEPLYVVIDEMLQLVIDGKKKVTELIMKLLAKAGA